MRTIRVGSRESELAVRQAGLVMDAIRRSCPDITLELVAMKTSGDRIIDRPLASVGGKGLFTRELDDALRNGRVDICVHSYKDVPAPDNPELPVVAVGRREDPRDVLVLAPGLRSVPDGARVGTSSLRRREQLAAVLPGAEWGPVRGNIRTRLGKLDAGEFAGLVLAAAGIRRLGLWERVGRVFETDEIVPAACQGALAVQGRAGEDHSYLSGFADADARDATIAERSFVEALGATCSSPVGAYAIVDADALTLRGFHVDGQNARFRGEKTGKRQDARAIGAALARELRGLENA